MTGTVTKHPKTHAPVVHHKPTAPAAPAPKTTQAAPAARTVGVDQLPDAPRTSLPPQVKAPAVKPAPVVAKTETAAPAAAAAPKEMGIKDRVVDHTARTEGGGRYDAWNANDKGQGVSFGLVQFNQKSGTLPSVIRQMSRVNPEKFDAIMGPLAHDARKTSWVRTADLNKPDTKARLLKLAREPEFQQVQRDAARTIYLEPFMDQATAAGVDSERGLSMIFDSAIQNGPNKTERLLTRAIAAGGTQAEILARFGKAADANVDAHGRRTALLKNSKLSDLTQAQATMLATQANQPAAPEAQPRG